MKKLLCCMGLFLLFTQGVNANIGSKPFHSLGWLVEDFTLDPEYELSSKSTVTGNLILGSSSGELVSKGDVEYNVDETKTSVSGSLKLSKSLVSICYNAESTVSESKVQSSYGDKTTKNLGKMDVGYLHQIDSLHLFASSYNESKVLKNDTYSVSASLNVFSFEIGGLYKISEQLLGGVTLIPAFGSKTEDSGYDFFLGSGNKLRIGIGYNNSALSTGLDVIFSTENKDYLSPSSTKIVWDGYYLLHEGISLKGKLAYIQSQELTSGNSSSQPYNEMSANIGLRVFLEKMIFMLGISQKNTNYEKYKTIDSSKVNLFGYQLGMTYNF